MISVKPANSLALGENVYDKDRHIVGMVGQSNQIYVRVENRNGTLTVGKDEDSCQIAYSIPEEKEADKLILLSGQCL